MDERVIERQVGSRTDHPVPVSLGGCCGDPGIDIGQFCAVFEGMHPVVDFLDRYGFENISSVKHNVLGVFVIHGHLGARIAEQGAAGGVDGPLRASFRIRAIGPPLAKSSI
jgi:hypothetical protein